MKMPKAAGNIWFASMPMPKAIFCPSGIRLVCMRYFSAYFLIFNADIVATPARDTGLKPVKGDFYAISGWTNALDIIEVI